MANIITIIANLKYKICQAVGQLDLVCSTKYFRNKKSNESVKTNVFIEADNK